LPAEVAKKAYLRSLYAYKLLVPALVPLLLAPVVKNYIQGDFWLTQYTDIFENCYWGLSGFAYSQCPIFISFGILIVVD
jgi:hypothetical protein